MTIEEIRALLHEYYNRTGRFAALLLYPCGSGCVVANEHPESEPELIPFSNQAELAGILRGRPVTESILEH